MATGAGMLIPPDSARLKEGARNGNNGIPEGRPRSVVNNL